MATKTKAEILADKAQRKIEKLEAKLKKVKDKSKANKETKESLKTKLWKIISPMVRESSDFCYTCDTPLLPREKQAGHCWPKGTHRAVEFDLDNIRVQCVSCNLYKSGNCTEFTHRLRNEIGEARWESLYQKKELKRYWTKELLKAEIAKYNLIYPVKSSIIKLS